MNPGRRGLLEAMPDPAPPEALLAHAGFLRALARGLLADEADAEDLVQETWLRALQSGPSRPEAWPAWLRTVTRNLAFKRLRGRARLRAREEDAARPEAVPSALDQVARDESLSGVVAAVLELPEHYREVVMLRYLEGLAPRHIAARLGQPVGTIRMRLHRALKRLRERLDESHGGERERWRNGLAVLVGAPPRGAAPAVALLPWFFLAVLVFTGGWLLLRRPAAERAPPAPALVADRARDDAAPPGEVARGGTRELVPPTTGPSTTGPPTSFPSGRDESAPAPRALVVRVVDAAGDPVGGAEVLATNERGDLETRGRSGDDGRASIALSSDHDPGRVLVAARGAGHAPSLVVPVDVDRETTLVVRGEEASVRGRVTDAEGLPLAGARVIVGEEFRLGLGQLGGRRRAARQVGRLGLGHEPELAGGPAYQLSRSISGFLGAQVLTRDGRVGRLPGVTAARADARGRFQVRGLEPGRARIRIEADGHAAFEAVRELPPGDLALDAIALERAAALVVRVGRADGLSHAGGVAYAWRDGARTGAAARFGADGTVRLDGLAPGPTWAFVETLEQGSPTRSARTLVTLAPGEATTWDAVVDDSAGIRGRLVDGDGRALAGWNVELRLDRLPSRTVARATSAADGAFHLPACPPLPGRLALFPPRGEPLLPSFVLGDVTAGADLGDVTASDAALAVVRGRVLDATGAPLADARLLLVPRTGTAAHPARTDSSGRFATTPLPAGTYDVLVPDLAPGTRAGEPLRLEPGGDVDVGVLRVPPPARLALETPDGSSRALDLRLARTRADSPPLVVFEGRADLPTEVVLGAGDWTVAFPGSSRAEVSIRLRPGERTPLTLTPP